MDRRALKFNSKRTDIESETTSSTNGNYLQTQPLKDNSNIRIIKVTTESTQSASTNSGSNLKEHQQLQQSSLNGHSNSNNNNSNNSNNLNNKGNERPLKCLETLAQKAGITFDEKYDFASPPHSGSTGGNNYSPIAVSTTPISNKTIIMEKSQSPAQQLTSSTAVPLQISPEQLQQLQQLQLQNNSPFAIQVKQEFPTHTTTTNAHQLGGTTGTSGELKHTGILDQNQLQQIQMQLAEAASGAGAPNSPATQQTPSSGAGAVAAMQQHSATISTMSPMQLTSAGQVSGDWSQGRTVQVMPQPTALNSGFLYHSQMLVPGNIFHSAGLTQQPIQVIAASKPFQGGTPQMITTQNAKQMLGGNASFPAGTYAIPSSQSPQTFLFSSMNPVNVISSSPQQQNFLQTMAATAAANAQQQQQQQQQQQNMAKVNAGQDAQKNMQQKVVQKVTTTTNTVQSAAGGAASGNVTQHQHQHAQQCVQVSSQTGMPTTTQIIGQIQGATGAPQQMQITAPWLPSSLPVWPNGLQQLTQNPIIIRGPQADGTPGGMFIQQPATATHSALQTSQQPNQITLQCNVAQPQSKPRTQLEAFVAKQQQAQVTQSQQTAVNALAAQHQAVAVAAASAAQLQQTTAAANSQRTPQLLPQNGAQLRPASSVSTQTAQNQSMLKHKIRSKQQPVRPALPTMKTENGQQKSQTLNAVSAAGLQQQLAAAANAATQHQQPTMHQVVTSAGNKMVVMSGTPITIQNGSTIQQAATATTHLDKQQQQQQIQLQQMQKQQFLQQQQLLQQQFAHIQIHQQQQQQHQPQQIQLQMAPATAQAILAQQQQQQQQQHLQNQILQQQQQLQQRDQQQNIIHQIVVQQSPQQQQQQQTSLANSLSQQQQHQLQQQQITAVPIAVPSSSATVVSAGGSIQSQQVTYQAKSQSLPTTSVVTISNHTGPLVTSTVGVNQAAQLQQNFIAATIASQQQQHQQSQIPQTQHTNQTQLPTQNPILAMASMINTPSNVGNTSLTPATSSNNTNVTSSTAQPIVSLPLSNITTASLSTLTATTAKGNAVDHSQGIQSKMGTAASTNLGTTLTTVDMGNRIPLSIASSNASTVASATNAPSVSLANELKETNNKLQQNSSAEQNVDTAPAKSLTPASTATSSASSNGESSTQNASCATVVDTTPTSLNTQQQSSTAKTVSTATTQSLSSITSPSKNSGSVRGADDANKGSVSSERSEKTVGSGTNNTTNEEKQSTSTGSQTAVSTSSSTPITKSSASGTAAKAEKTDLPKAMIKPNVLTHVIDDFIIQEASEPFPVTRQRYADKDTIDEPPKKKVALDDISSHSVNLSLPPDMVACENCGKAEHKAKLKKKRFCSLTCARQAKTSSNDQQMEVAGNNESGGAISLHSTNEGSISTNATVEKMQVDLPPHANGLMTSSNGHQQQQPLSGNPLNESASTVNSTVANSANGEQQQMMNWSVSEVCDFIKNLPGCSDYVDDFEQQEIDGQALLLLKENHLVNAMGMKLGPALKIVAKVESMKDVNTSASTSNAEKEATPQQ